MLVHKVVKCQMQPKYLMNKNAKLNKLNEYGIYNDDPPAIALRCSHSFEELT